MRNPREMRIIEIETTNACVRECSNCTRFCGHHKKPFFMEFETFKRAVDSLEGYEGIVGMMGGEPTLHPQFKQMAEYLGEKFGNTEKLNTDKLVLNDFPMYINHKHNAMLAICKDSGAGLLTSMTEQYYKHYELIQKTFSFQNLNDHTKISYHQPILVSRKDFGISDEDWPGIRDNCWLQNYWSASISPKGVFFCEIASSLDMLFGGPGGFPIEPGWWKRDISEFSSQFHWCELCGVALPTFEQYKRDANEETDDISPLLLEKLKAIGSGKVQKGKFSVFTAKEGDVKKEEEKKFQSAVYISEDSDRFGASLRRLRPKSLLTVDADGRERVGQTLFSALNNSSGNDWVLLKRGNENAFIDEEQLKELYMNTGVCFDFEGQLLFNANASALKKAGPDRLLVCETAESVKALWESRDIVYLSEGFENECLAYDISRWKSMAQTEILNDYDFRNRLKEVFAARGIKDGGKILLITPCTFYFGRGVYALLENMGYEPHMFVYSGNKCHYEDAIPKGRLHTFVSSKTYDYEKLKGEYEALKSIVSFDGSIMLVITPYSELAPKDGYGEAYKIARHMAEFAGCFNVRRKPVAVRLEDSL